MASLSIYVGKPQFIDGEHSAVSTASTAANVDHAVASVEIPTMENHTIDKTTMTKPLLPALLPAPPLLPRLDNASA